MAIPTIAELLVQAELEFKAVLGNQFRVRSHETFGESHYRGGFCLTLSGERHNCEITYSDMQLEVRFNGSEVFGVHVHIGFEGNMFSREHLRDYLPRIAESSAATARSNSMWE